MAPIFCLPKAVYTVEAETGTHQSNLHKWT